MMCHRRRVRGTRFLACLLAAAVAVAASPLALAGRGSLFGSVVSGNTAAPLVGVRVHVGEPTHGTVVATTTTGADGRYAAPDLPAGSYQIAVETGTGLYVVESTVTVADGRDLRLNLALEPGRASSGPTVRRSAGGVWSSPLTATLVVVGAAVAIGALIESSTDDEEQPASPLE